MGFIQNFVSRLRVTPAFQSVDTELVTVVPALPDVCDSSIAVKSTVIFAPIMASLKRIEEYVDTLPDKPTGAVQS